MGYYLQRPGIAALNRANAIVQSCKLFIPFSEAAGAIASDLVRGSVGTFNSLLGWTMTPWGKCPDFNGTSQYIDFGASIENIAGQFTIWTMVQMQNTTRGYQLFCSKGPDPGESWSFRTNATTGKTQLVTYPNNSLVSVIGNTVLTNNQWYLLGATYDGTTQTVWVDGVNDGSTSASGALNINTNSVLVGTRAAHDLWFEGRIAAIGIHNRVLTGRDFKALKNDPFLMLRSDDDLFLARHNRLLNLRRRTMAA